MIENTRENIEDEELKDIMCRKDERRMEGEKSEE